ncbi:uncharacterized protein [Apostichopus japonicus]|uniref:uncharacterized protein n=1 Tax=Stichopus japonicus TaxID=307972 RepID=UPI003AB6CC63
MEHPCRDCCEIPVLSSPANKSQQSRKDLLKSAGEAWRKIQANKTSFNNYNLAASKKNANDKKLSQHQMKPWQNKVVKEMQVLCEKLEEQNCEAFVAVVNSDGELITAGTDMAKNFMQREDLFLQRFGLAVSGKEQFACKSKDSWDDLRCKVQEIFNEKFCALTGERRMSYKKIVAGKSVFVAYHQVSHSIGHHHMGWKTYRQLLRIAVKFIVGAGEIDRSPAEPNPTTTSRSGATFVSLKNSSLSTQTNGPS